MMQMTGAIIQLAILILSRWFESNAEKKKKKEEIINALKEGIVNDDPSAITAAFDQLR